MNLQFFILLETLMHKIAQETINSNFSQNAMNRNRSRKKQKKPKKTQKTTIHIQGDLHACLNGSTDDIYDADEVFEK